MERERERESEREREKQRYATKQSANGASETVHHAPGNMTFAV